MATVVLSSLPVGCVESDIHRALLMYGTAISIVMDPTTAQAVVTMRTRQEAQALLNRRSVNVIGTSVRVDAQMSPPSQQQTQSQPQPHYLHPQSQSQPLQQQQQQQQQIVPSPLQQPQQLMAGPGYLYGNGVPTSFYTNPVAQPPLSAPATQPQSYPVQQQPLPPLHTAQPPHATAGNYTSIPGQMPTGSGHAIMPAPPLSTPRLRVLVEDCRYPITRDVLTQMFSMIAPPVSVSCGPYGPTTTGAVEFADAASAQKAMDQFHNNAIYPNCCYVKLFFEPVYDRYAAMPEPAPQRPYGGGAQPDYSYPPQTSAYPPSAHHANSHGSYPQAQAPVPPSQYEEDWNRAENGTQSQRPAPPAAAPPLRPQATPPADSYGYSRGGDRAEAQHTEGDDGALSFEREALEGGRGAGSGSMARGGRGALRGGIGGRGGGPGSCAADGFSPYAPSRAPPPARGAHGGPVRPTPSADGCTVMVSGVSPSVSLYELWVLLEVFGNVNSLKRQFKERTNVVAQFQHPGDALTAVQYLQRCPFRGQVVRLKRFIGYYEWETNWETGPAKDPATQAALFTTGYHHRTAPVVPVNVRGRVHPDKNVYISNLTEAISDEEVKAFMADAGFPPESYFRRGPKGAIVAYKDTETAVDALIALHAKEVRGRFLRVTFSRFPPGPRLPTTGETKEEVDEENDEGANAEQRAQAEEGIQPPQSSTVEPPATGEWVEALQPAPTPQETPSTPEAVGEEGGEAVIPKPPPKAAKAKAKSSRK